MPLKPPVIGDQPAQPGQGLESNKSSLAWAALAAGGIGASGFIPTKSGRLWDNYIRGIRAVETGFPAAILRTFRISEFLSPLESWQSVAATAEQTEFGSYGAYLRSTFGPSKQFTLSRTGALFGEVTDEAGEVLGYGLQMRAGTQKGTAIADYYARIAGLNLGPHESLNEALLRTEHRNSKSLLPYEDWKKLLEPDLRRKRLIIGTKLRNKLNILGHDFDLSQTMAKNLAKGETVLNLFRAKAASTAGRLNTLLTAPFDLPGLKALAAKFPVLHSMAVAPGSNAEILGRLVKKGVYAGLAWTGLEYYDYLRSEGSPWSLPVGMGLGAGIGHMLTKKPGLAFSKLGVAIGAGIGFATAVMPRFEHGLFHGAATIGTDINLARTEASSVLGITESLQNQERVTPGLNNLSTALGFAGVGALTTGMYSYGSYVKQALVTRRAGETLASAFERTRDIRALEGLDKIWSSTIGKKISNIPILKNLTKIKSPMALGAIGGLLAWQGLTSATSLLSGNFWSAIPGVGLLGTTETPEELEAIYSGEKEIPVYRGRWWEMGRCLANSVMIPMYYDNIVKKIDEVQVGDILISRDGIPTKVLNVFTRYHSGEIIGFSCAYDRDTIVSVTKNHKIPILKKQYSTNKQRIQYRLQEVEASKIKLNDYVEIPIKKLSSNIKEVRPLEYIQDPVFLQDNKIYASQRNWYSGKLQKSGQRYIPTLVPLNRDTGFLFGIYLAEGNIGFHGASPTMIEMVHSIHEEWIVHKIQTITEEYFDTITTVRFKDTSKKTKEGCYITRICNSMLAKFFRWLLYPQEYNAYNKSIPDVFMYASEEFKEGLIDGYYAGDGHWDTTRVISSSRKWLLERIQQIAFSINLLSGISPKEENNFLGKWKLRFVSKNATSPAILEYQGKIYAAIRSINIEEYNDIVYDFEVDHPDHLFMAGTFLVHNSSHYRGQNIDYFRQHMLPRLRSRAYEKGLYGSEEEYWAHHPLLHPVEAIAGDDDWKYWYEKKYQYSRPGTISSTYGQDIPFIGPVVAATIGKLIKPRKLIRPEEWITDEGLVYLPDPRGENEPAYHLGGLAPGAPVAPDEASQLLNELNYRRREAVGLVGFAEGALTKAAIGREEVFPNLQTLSVMGKETGSEYWLWKHLNLSGAVGTSEATRRFIPRTRSYLDTYNPLKADVPSWYPKDYFTDPQYGNLFSGVPEYELRGPGPGYAALNPEVEGLSPEDYPLAHKVKILGDIFPYSDEFRRLSRYALNQNLSDKDKAMVQTAVEHVAAIKQKREFQEYTFRPEELAQENVTISEVLSPRRFRTKEYGDLILEAQGVGRVLDSAAAMQWAQKNLVGKSVPIYTSSIASRKYDTVATGSRLKAVPMVGDVDYAQLLADEGLAETSDLNDEFKQLRYSWNERLAGKISETVLHNIETPLESLTPMSPAAKLIRQRSALEEYAKSEAFGTSASFWDRPYENFLKPAIDMTAHRFGGTSIPSQVQQKRDLMEYYDMLQWVKMSRLEQLARLSGDRREAAEFRQAKESTLFGVDVFGSPVGPRRALPRRERDFFEAFEQAKTEDDRATILEMIPENEQRLYISRWLQQEAGAAQARVEAKIGTEVDDKIINAKQMLYASQGFKYTPDDAQRWQQETGGDIPFDEWIREQKAREYFQTHSLPSDESVLWNPAVDLKDVEIIDADMTGIDFHELDLWEQRKKSLARKPYLSAEVVEDMYAANTAYENSWKIAANSKALQKMYGTAMAEIRLARINANIEDGYNITIQDGREELINKAYKELGA